MADSTEHLLTPGSSGENICPAVYGNRVVWVDGRATHWGGYDTDIYLLTVGAPEICPIADFTADSYIDPPRGTVGLPMLPNRYQPHNVSYLEL